MTEIQTINGERVLVTDNPIVASCFIGEEVEYTAHQCDADLSQEDWCSMELLCVRRAYVEAEGGDCPDYPIYIPIKTCKEKATWREGETKVWVVDSTGEYLSDGALVIRFEGFRLYSLNLITISEGNPEIIKEIIG